MEIAIIGGGITGLTTALALHKMGIKATVYEQAAELNEIGAGVWLQPNAVSILNWLGLKNEVASEGMKLNKMEITYPNLKPIKPIKDEIVSDTNGNQTIAIHRGKLQKILYEAFKKVGTVELGMEYLSHSENNGDIVIKFAGKEKTTNVLLGADGINSNVRNTLQLPSTYRKSGQMCFRGISNIELPNELKNRGKEVWGKKIRFGFSEISDNYTYFFAVLNKEICPKNVTSASLIEMFSDFHPIVSKIIEKTNFLHHTELYDLKRLDTWYKSNTCLLGDAAHATTPNMGQGACQGIEDAYYFSKVMSKSPLTISKNFENFEKTRRKKVDHVVNTSWQFGKMIHNPLGQSVLKLIMKSTPDRVMNKQMKTLYAVEEL